MGCVEPSSNPQVLRGHGILNLSIHMMAHRFSLLQDMCSDSHSWISIVQYFIENKGLTHGGQQLRHHGSNYWTNIFHLRFLALYMFNTWLSHGQSDLFMCMKPSSSIEHCNSFQKELFKSS